MTHQIWFAHPYVTILSPVCRVCCAPLTMDTWLDGEECPGSVEDQLMRATARLFEVLK